MTYAAAAGKLPGRKRRRRKVVVVAQQIFTQETISPATASP